MTRSSSQWPDIWHLGPIAWLGMAAALGVAAGLVVGKASSPLILLVLGVGGVGAALILALPEVGLLVLVFTTYTNLSDVLIRSHGAPSVAKLLAPLVLIAIALRWARTGERPRGWGRPALLILVYGFACTLSLFAAREPAETIEGLVTLGKNSLVFLCIVALVQSGATLRKVVWTLIGAAIFLGTISVHQQLTGNFDFDYWGFGRSPVGFALEGEHTVRLGGPIGDPNSFGMLFLALVPLALDRVQSERKPMLRLVALWGLLVSLFTIFFTYSRSALLSLLALVGLIVVVRRPKPLHLLAAVVVVLLLLPLAPSSYTDRLAQLGSSVIELTESGTTQELSVRGRLSENLVALGMFVDHPVVGVGLGNYPARYQEYSRGIGLDPRVRRQPHNLYLEVLSETGLVGFVTFGLLLWITVGGALESRKAALSAGRHDLARLMEGVLLAFVGYLIASVFLHAAHPRYFWLLAAIVLALPQVARNELTPGEAAAEV